MKSLQHIIMRPVLADTPNLPASNHPTQPLHHNSKHLIYSPPHLNLNNPTSSHHTYTLHSTLYTLQYTTMGLILSRVLASFKKEARVLVSLQPGNAWVANEAVNCIA